MKTRFLIIIVIASIGITSVGLLVTIDYFQNFEYPPPCGPRCPGNQLQAVLDYCNDTTKEKNLIGLKFFNDTHYIDNITCEWQKIENGKPEPIKIKVTRQPGSVVISDNINVPLPFGSDPQKQKESQELWRLASKNTNYTIYNNAGILDLDLMVKQLHEYCEINYLPACKDLPIINLNGSSRNEN